MVEKRENKRYTSAERKAYYMGVGAAIGFGKTREIDKVRKRLSPIEKKSFYNGFDDYLERRSRGTSRTNK